MLEYLSALLRKMSTAESIWFSVLLARTLTLRLSIDPIMLCCVREMSAFASCASACGCCPFFSSADADDLALDVEVDVFEVKSRPMGVLMNMPMFASGTGNQLVCFYFFSVVLLVWTIPIRCHRLILNPLRPSLRRASATSDASSSPSFSSSSSSSSSHLSS